MSEPRNDFAPGVITGNEVKEVFALAEGTGFALPAANCIGSNSMNAVMETAAKLNSPVIIQFSNSGGAFIAGKVDRRRQAPRVGARVRSPAPTTSTASPRRTAHA